MVRGMVRRGRFSDTWRLSGIGIFGRGGLSGPAIVRRGGLSGIERFPVREFVGHGGLLGVEDF